MSRRLHATHTGGCGFWLGLGTTLRGGIVTCSPAWPVNGVSVMQRSATAEAFLPHRALLAGSTPNPPSSASDDDSPVPNSTRPPREQVERGDALGDAGRMVERRRRLHDPVPEPEVLVRCDAAARNTSGALEWQYSSRKWCSTTQHGVDADPVGELALLQRLLEHR